MKTWTYTIRMGNGNILTSNHQFAEVKSKQGYYVSCKRTSNVFRYHY